MTSLDDTSRKNLVIAASIIALPFLSRFAFRRYRYRNIKTILNGTNTKDPIVQDTLLLKSIADKTDALFDVNGNANANTSSNTKLTKQLEAIKDHNVLFQNYLQQVARHKRIVKSSMPFIDQYNMDTLTGDIPRLYRRLSVDYDVYNSKYNDFVSNANKLYQQNVTERLNWHSEHNWQFQACVMLHNTLKRVLPHAVKCDEYAANIRSLRSQSRLSSFGSVLSAGMSGAAAGSAVNAAHNKHYSSAVLYSASAYGLYSASNDFGNNAARYKQEAEDITFQLQRYRKNYVTRTWTNNLLLCFVDQNTMSIRNSIQLLEDHINNRIVQDIGAHPITNKNHLMIVIMVDNGENNNESLNKNH